MRRPNFYPITITIQKYPKNPYSHLAPHALSPKPLQNFESEKFFNDYICMLCHQGRPKEALQAFQSHKSASFEIARRVFEEMPQRNLVSWTSIIAGYTQHHLEREALELYLWMLRAGFRPDQFTFASAVRACSGLAQQRFEFKAILLFRDMHLVGVSANEFVFGSIFMACSCISFLDQGRQIHGLCLKYGFGVNAFVGCSLSSLYAKCGSLGCAEKVFYQIRNPDLASWNAMLVGYAQGGGINEAIMFFSQMRHHGMRPDEISVRCLLGGCMDAMALFQGQQIHTFIIKMNFSKDISVCNTLLTMYTNCSSLSGASLVFESMILRDLVSWNAMIAAYLKHDHGPEVLRLLRLLHSAGMKPDQFTMGSGIGACADLAALEPGNQIHGYVNKIGLGSDLSISNALIDLYSKCGSLEDAHKVFTWMSDPDVVSWSSLVVGYAQYGYGEEALHLFSKMQDLGIKPNHITLVGVLSACSRIGLIDVGAHVFRNMERDHGIVPTREHYACMVDLFGRAGHLKEAEDFISRMPFEPDPIVWKTLLAACRTHGNLELGKRAAENILNLDPSNSSAFVLLSNMYARSNSWEEVARLRKLMKSRGVRKDPGLSWIKVKDKVHVFVSEDGNHPQMEDVYVVSLELSLHMREAGYAPDLGFALDNP
ncbi:pentatricopeptide repeat-containing protein At3g53360, mitochondrial isoform X1 [Amborella trichopoda]|uniref:pentatricopeptide repeat-containing protein At3g53360, mitochondrial isoform X1 n=1 Tax=Amborella trichopoda TaxID=13333 RepID=UPI0009C1A6A3|nr:pentatricopeptide repeat-containing protein At3g53360, mitochondrial isoform X1 [Amborella trichopoda]|eukprot:XP_020520637.1 pentatricopeptide repeat-containing protein At3g53360, mitochondrial isoform X1 [Amborella trichopoda]